MKSNNCFQTALQKFFLQWMMSQRNLSPETIKSYRDSFKLYIKYLNKKYRIVPSHIEIAHLEAEYILGFLGSLEEIRHNQPKTINNRLAAIHAFLRFLAFEMPEYSSLFARSLEIPFRKEEKRQMDFLTKDEITSMLNACDTSCVLGRRDQLMILMLYNTGVRVSELLSLRDHDIIFDKSNLYAHIRVVGKGRKERCVPLWKNVTCCLKEYIRTSGIKENDKIFINHNGRDLTRSGVRHRLLIIVHEAEKSMPSLSRKTITPHTFRHSTALHLLQSGVDISTIAIWLGHESIATTHKYMEADMEMKKKILENMSEPSVNEPIYSPNGDLLDFLMSL